MSGVGLSATVRLRMSSHDAHYGGGLVDGARMLGLFGDVATELLVRLDGDEGLFRAYQSVEFLAPVHAGDFIEATGRIVAVGATSRTMEFEARKVIRPRPDVSDSAAEVLAAPVVVCRAKGTCVTPAAKQRGALAPAELPRVVDLEDKLATFSAHWQPRIVGQFNGHDLMVVKVKGEFIWHHHADTDDFFLVLDGRLTIDLPGGQAVTLGPGQLVVVPRGMEHRPWAEEETRILLIEPAGTPNTGDPATAVVKVRV